MNRFIKITVVALVAVGMAIPAGAQEYKKVGQTGLQFLKNDMSARSAGMGGASVQVADDASAMFGNPAGIAYVQSGFDAFATYTPWIADINYTAAGVVMGLGNVGSIGVNVMMVDYGQIIGTKVDETAEGGYVETGDLDVAGMAAGVAYSRRLTDKFIVGGQVRYTTQDLGSSEVLVEGETELTHEVKNSVSGVAAEIGTIFYPGIFESFKFGMSVKNFSQQLQYEDEAFQLPLTFMMGISIDVFEVMGMDNGNRLLLAVDAIHPRDYTERLHLGTEFSFMDMAFLRAGYKFNYDVESLSVGGGVKLSMAGIALRVDGAYSLIEDFDDVMKFTVGLSL
jgi:hypothetical protein